MRSAHTNQGSSGAKSAMSKKRSLKRGDKAMIPRIEQTAFSSITIDRQVYQHSGRCISRDDRWEKLVRGRNALFWPDKARREGGM
jgi:hypothetical protein